MKVEVISAFKDNYIWVFGRLNDHEVYVVDPGEALPVITYCEQHALKLIGILVTHHHYDHTGGIDELRAWAKDIPVYGPESPFIHNLTHPIQKEGRLQLLHWTCQVLKVPGHTLDHIAYYFDTLDTPVLFIGDTLFSAGCGRLFEGDAAMMFNSLAKISALSNETKIYCAHEYTVSNLTFAKLVEPNNADQAHYAAIVDQKRQQGIPSLPTTLAQEKMINPFLRTRELAVIQSVSENKTTLLKPVEVFKKLREWKDSF